MSAKKSCRSVRVVEFFGKMTSLALFCSPVNLIAHCHCQCIWFVYHIFLFIWIHRKFNTPYSLPHFVISFFAYYHEKWKYYQSFCRPMNTTMTEIETFYGIKLTLTTFPKMVQIFSYKRTLNLFIFLFLFRYRLYYTQKVINDQKTNLFRFWVMLAVMNVTPFQNIYSKIMLHF